MAASNWSSGTAALISPQSTAVAALIGSPVIAISSARLRPTLRATATSGVWQNRPPLPPGMAKPALSAATARSQVATSWHPAAVARACTRAMTTWGIDCTVSIISVHTSNRWRASSSEAPFMSPKLCPAENTGPVAARMTPVASDWPTACSAAVSSSITSSASALRFSGRLRVMVVTGPWVATSRCWYVMGAVLRAVAAGTTLAGRAILGA